MGRPRDKKAMRREWVQSKGWDEVAGGWAGA